MYTVERGIHIYRSMIYMYSLSVMEEDSFAQTYIAIKRIMKTIMIGWWYTYWLDLKPGYNCSLKKYLFTAEWLLRHLIVTPSTASETAICSFSVFLAIGPSIGYHQLRRCKRLHVELKNYKMLRVRN